VYFNLHKVITKIWLPEKNTTKRHNKLCADADSVTARKSTFSVFPWEFKYLKQLLAPARQNE
jgi:hypothetical protein